MRTAGTIIREIATTKAADIPEDLKQAIMAELRNELRAMYAAKAQQQSLPIDQLPTEPPKRR